MSIEIIVSIVLVIALVFVWNSLRIAKQNLQNLKRFEPILNVEEESKKIIEAARNEEQKIRFDYNIIQEDTKDLQEKYKEKKHVYDNLLAEIGVYEEKKNFIDVGMYEPHFSFEDSDQFKECIKRIRDKQKNMIKNKQAVICHIPWIVDGSRSKGKTMTNRNIRLSLRAFNNECDAAVSNVRWNNVDTMKNRIYKAYEQINKLNESNHIEIEDSFLDLKIEELRATHEYREKKKDEREERLERAREEREEAKQQKELMDEIKRLEKEESDYQKMLDKAKEEAKHAVGDDIEKYEAKIAELTKELENAHTHTERAKSMAQITKRGYIYVISNIGSFGEGVYKIGMTRRLEPMDRVKELGDASVPFRFDTHAMIYCEDAPMVEKALHDAFNKQRVNLVNNRKEFFRVSLDAIKVELDKIAPGVDIVTGVEAQEYYETLAVLNVDNKSESHIEDAFPTEL